MRQNVSQTRPVKWRSCETSTIAPGKSLSASASASRMCDQREREPCALAAGEAVDDFECALAGEIPAAKKIAKILGRDAGRDVAQMVDRRLPFVQRLDGVLRKIAEHEIRMHVAFASQQRQFADQRFHQRRFAGAVRTQVAAVAPPTGT